MVTQRGRKRILCDCVYNLGPGEGDGENRASLSETQRNHTAKKGPRHRGPLSSPSFPPAVRRVQVAGTLLVPGFGHPGATDRRAHARDASLHFPPPPAPAREAVTMETSQCGRERLHGFKMAQDLDELLDEIEAKLCRPDPLKLGKAEQSRGGDLLGREQQRAEMMENLRCTGEKGGPTWEKWNPGGPRCPPRDPPVP